MLFDCGSVTHVRRGIESLCHLGSHYQREITSESESIVQIRGPCFLCMRKLPVSLRMLDSIFSEYKQ